MQERRDTVDLKELLGYWKKSAELRVDSARELLKGIHHVSIGDTAEDAVRAMLSVMLPPDTALGEGFALPSELTAPDKLSRQTDIVVYNPCKSVFPVGQTCFFPAEAVLMGVEVKTTVDLDDILKKVQALKRCERALPANEDDNKRPGLEFRKRPLALAICREAPAAAAVVAHLAKECCDGTPQCDGCKRRAGLPAVQRTADIWKEIPDCNCRSKRLPDLFVALTGPKGTPEENGYVLGYKEWYPDSKRYGFSPHPHRAEGFVVDSSDHWIGLLVCSLEILLRSAMEATRDLPVRFDRYLGRVADDELPCEVFNFQGKHEGTLQKLCDRTAPP